MVWIDIVLVAILKRELYLRDRLSDLVSRLSDIEQYSKENCIVKEYKIPEDLAKYIAAILKRELYLIIRMLLALSLTS